ncbi:unnamed protein product [Bathycoccus prasinos]
MLMRSRGLLESSPATKKKNGAVLNIKRREEDGDGPNASSSVTFRILVVLFGVFCGFVLSSYASGDGNSQSRMGKGVQDLHRNVKGAYRAHNEARKEYLKRYRESYLEAVFASGGENIQKEKEEEEGGGEKGGDAAVAEVLAQMSEVAGEQTERANKIEGGVSVTPVPVIESPPPPPPSPLSQRTRGNAHVYIFHHLSDFGLGHLMGEFANVYEILDMLGVGSVSIRECGTPRKPWHSGKMQPCEDSFRHNKNVVKYGKRSSDIDVSLGPNEETEDMKSFVHIDGQSEDWIQALENMTNPETPTNVFITEPHNKYITNGKYGKVTDNNSCAGINKWFGDPSAFLLEELENHKKWQNIRGTEFKTHQNDIAFHFRLLDHEDLGIEVQPDLSIKIGHREIKLGDQRLDNEDGYGRLAHLDLKRAVDDVIDFAKKIFETSGLTTFVASDAPAIQAYLKNNPVISMIEHVSGMSDEEGEDEIADHRDLRESHYSLTSALELYELGTAKKIVSFPFSSGFSRAASCLIKDGEYLGTLKTLDDLEKVISTYAPTSPPPPQFDYESECKLAESFGNRFQEYDLREFLPSEEEGYPQMAGTGWEPYRWRDDETYISTWTSLNARGIVNKVLSNVTLDEKRACVPAEPERLAIDVAIIHFRCADVPFNDELSYPLAPPEYSVFVGKKLKELDVKRIIPVMCSVHKVEESIVEERKRLCTELFDAQLDIIKREFTEEISIDAISCLSDIETLFLVRDAAAVAQLIPSSFTFIAGLARSDAKSFITPHYGLKEAKAIQILSPLEEEKHRVRLKNMADNLPWNPRCFARDVARVKTYFIQTVMISSVGIIHTLVID